jgi:hypothetical protein
MIQTCILYDTPKPIIIYVLRKHLLLDVRGELSDDVACWAVLANMELSLAVLGIKDAIAAGDCTANLGGGLPDHLSEVGRLGVGWVVILGFAGPGAYCVRDTSEAAASSIQVLTVGTERSSGMLELALVSPGLSRFGEAVAPGQRLGTVLGTKVVVALEIVVLSSTSLKWASYGN